MKTVNSSIFQRTYHSETEPVAVTANGRPLGTWYPAGTEQDRPSPVELPDNIATIPNTTDWTKGHPQPKAPR